MLHHSIVLLHCSGNDALKYISYSSMLHAHSLATNHEMFIPCGAPCSYFLPLPAYLTVYSFLSPRRDCLSLAP